MLQEKVRAERPWQFKRVDPDGAKPHAAMVGEVARFDQLACPCIKDGDACAPLYGFGVRCVQAFIAVYIFEGVVAGGMIVAPNLRAVL